MTKTVQQYVEIARDQCALSLQLDFSGFQIRIATNSERLLENLADYFKYFLRQDADEDCKLTTIQVWQTDVELTLSGAWQDKPPEAGKTRVKEQLLTLGDGFVVRKRNSGMQLFYGDAQLRLCRGAFLDDANQLINAICNVHLDYLLQSEGQLFHAAGVSLGNDGLGLAGASGRGKSSLALRLLSRGLDFVSNDRLVVTSNNQLTMQGIAKYPRVNPGTMMHQAQLKPFLSAELQEKYSRMPATELWPIEEKYDALIEPAFQAEFNLQAEMKAFVILDWQGTQDSHASIRLQQYQPREVSELVAAVIKVPDLMLPMAQRRLPKADLENYLGLLESCNLYVLSGSINFEAAADEIMAVLKDLTV